MTPLNPPLRSGGSRGSERGAALVMVLAFMALSIPLITGALRVATTMNVDSRVKEDIATSHYTAVGGSEYAEYRLAYEPGYSESLQAGVPDTFAISVNGDLVDVTVLNTSNHPGDPPPPPGDNSRRLRAYKSVLPTATAPLVLTTFTYTVTVVNEDDTATNFRKVHDRLLPGFTYLTGSTQGVTTDDPTITFESADEEEPAHQHLEWNLASLGLSLEPWESADLVFSAQAALPQGNYCNEVWVEPGGDKTTSGKTARVTVGSPPNNLCAGKALDVAKTVQPAVVVGDALTTYTYTIGLDNVGTADLTMDRIRDLLPAGFLYVASSTTGDVTTADPATTMWQGRQRLTWDFAPGLLIQPADQRVLTFQTQAQAVAGDYWNEVWVTLEEFSYTLYTGPTAQVQAMSVTGTEATDGDTTVTAEIWLGSGTHIINGWNVPRSPSP